MKDLAKIAILAIATLTFEACSSTRSTTKSNGGADSTKTVNPTSGTNSSGSGDLSINPENGTKNSMVNGTANTTGGGNSTTATDTGTTVTGGTTTSVNGTTTKTTSSTAGTNNTMDTANNNPIPGSTGTTGTENVKSADDSQQFIHEAAIGGLSEVQLSQLALKKAQSTAVKQFASMMVKDHSGANAELKTLAASKSITLTDSTTLNQAGMANSGTTATGNGFKEKSANNSSTANSGAVTTGNNSSSANLSPSTDITTAEKIEKLNSSSGKDFDNNYVQIMIFDHEKAVNLFEQGSKSSDPQIKAYATKHLLTLKMHLQLITALGKSTSSTSGLK